MAAEAVESGISAGGENFRETVWRKQHEGAATAEFIGGGGEDGVRGLRVGGGFFALRGRDAGFAAGAGEHDARIEVAIRLGQEIGDLGVAIFLENNGGDRGR